MSRFICISIGCIVGSVIGLVVAPIRIPIAAWNGASETYDQLKARQDFEDRLFEKLDN
jgi:hypothetical protein